MNDFKIMQLFKCKNSNGETTLNITIANVLNWLGLKPLPISFVFVCEPYFNCSLDACNWNWGLRHPPRLLRCVFFVVQITKVLLHFLTEGIFFEMLSTRSLIFYELFFATVGDTNPFESWSVYFPSKMPKGLFLTSR